MSFYDVSDPAKPKELAFVPFAPGGKAHGLDADDRYAYVCGQFSTELNREGLQIIDYSESAQRPRRSAPGTSPGRSKGEQYGPLNRNGPDGKPQIIQCHEIVYLQRPPLRRLARRRHGDPRRQGPHQSEAARDLRLQSAVPRRQSRRRPHIAAGGDRQGEHPDLVVHTDEIFDCPPGFGRILDVSDLKNPEVVKGERPANVVLLSTFRFDYVSDKFDHSKKTFVCDTDGPGGRSGTTTHLPLLDQRSPSLVYITWYDEGVRVMDISNPFAPVFVGHFLSPRTGAPAAGKDRQTREIFQDPDTGLLYLTDGNGAGLMVLRYTGPIPDKHPDPGRAMSTTRRRRGI